MTNLTLNPAQPRGWTRAGWALTALLGVFMVFDSAIKLVPIDAVAQALEPLGFPTDPGFERGLGLLGLACTLLYLFLRTAVLGAVLLTGYFGKPWRLKCGSETRCSATSCSAPISGSSPGPASGFDCLP